MKCEKCQKEAFIPFRCQYCGRYFCPEHRLPENHECLNLELARAPTEDTRPLNRPESHKYIVTYGGLEKAKSRLSFSKKEISHLAVAALLVIGVGLSMVKLQELYRDHFILAAFTTLLAISFFAHEIAHKAVAQRKGLWAEFRLTPIGAILTLLSVVSPIFKIISPGAVVVSGFADAESIGKVSIGGPVTNIALSISFLAATFLFPTQSSASSMLAIGAAFNSWIALFNLIPFGVFDGFKVFLWDKRIWASTFTASLVLTVVSYSLLP